MFFVYLWAACQHLTRDWINARICGAFRNSDEFPTLFIIRALRNTGLAHVFGLLNVLFEDIVNIFSPQETHQMLRSLSFPFYNHYVIFKLQRCRLFSLIYFSFQDVFLMIRRHKTTIFTDAKESTTVYELKRIVEGILKRPPEDQRLYKVN